MYPLQHRWWLMTLVWPCINHKCCAYILLCFIPLKYVKSSILCHSCSMAFVSFLSEVLMQASGVRGLEAIGQQGQSRSQATLFLFFPALYVASAPTSLVPDVLVTHTYAHSSPAAEGRLHIVSSEHQNISWHLGRLQQSRDEEVSPSGNSRTPAGHRLCTESKKARLSVSYRFI